MFRSKWFKASILSSTTLVLSLGSVTPAVGMVLNGGAAANEAAKLFGAGSGGAICLVDVMWDNEFEVGTGTLIRVDRATGTGVVLTSAHSLLKFGIMPRAIALSFAANPVTDLSRIYATGYLTHPEYRYVPDTLNGGAPKTGPDLALIRFKLPAGFKADPMLLPSQGAEARPGVDGHYLMGGYGLFALNGESKGWDEGIENGRVRRIASSEFQFKDREKAIADRDSLEATHPLHSQAEITRAGQGRPFWFKPSPDTLVLGTSYNEAVPTTVDSGGPVFRYDGEAHRFRIMAVFGANGFGRLGEGGKAGAAEVIANASALTPEVCQWLAAATAQDMQAISHNAKDQIILRMAYSEKYGLKLTHQQLIAQ